jgi:long-subunit acyl-CoA synthetase (AMP-forming)
VKEQILKEIQLVAKESSLPGWEVPISVVLEPHAFTVDNGLLTSTLKKSRPKLEQKYKPVLEALYEEINASTAHR